MSENAKGIWSWNLPAASALVAAALMSFAPGRLSVRPGTSSVANAPQTTSVDPFLPTPDGLVSYPTGIWDDPFVGRHDALKGLRERRQPAISSDLQEEAQQDDNRPDHYKTVISKFVSYGDGPKNRLLVMPVIVLGEDGGSDAVDRTQYRHAVENALAFQGFSMEFPDQMSFAELPNLQVIRGKSKTFVDAAIPIKLYAKKLTSGSGDKKLGVIVLWVDRRWLGDTPLAVLNTVVNQAVFDPAWNARCKDCTSVSIIGPVYTDDLQVMVSEAYGSDTISKATMQSWFGDTRENRTVLFSPSATAYCLCDVEALSKVNIDLLHTIGQNKQLIEALTDEIKLRWLDHEDILLFTEAGYDSPENLKEHMKSENKAAVIRVVPVLRGLSRTSGDSHAASVRDVQDYFYRALSGIAGTRKERESFKLIGVFVNGIDDKVTIIRAARPIFPNATFFTVDLHSQYTRDENLPFTRNLLVASHFGLRLPHSELTQNQSTSSREPLTFRDSYQTSVFRAASLALDVFATCNDTASYAARITELQGMWTNPGTGRLEPLLFEIGQVRDHQLAQRRAVVLTTSTVCVVVFAALGVALLHMLWRLLVPRESAGPHQLSIASIVHCIWFEIVLTVVGTLLFCYQSLHGDRGAAVAGLALLWLGASFFPPSRAKSKRAFVGRWAGSWVALTVFAVFAVPLLLVAFYLEPYSSSSGISIWPSVALSLVVCVLAAHRIGTFCANPAFPWTVMREQLDIGIARGHADQSDLSPSQLLYLCWTSLLRKKSMKSDRLREFAESITDWRIPKYARFLPPRTNALWLVRLLSTALLAAIGAVGYARGLHFEPPPARGETAILVTFVVHMLATLLVFLLVGFALLQTLALRGILSLCHTKLRREKGKINDSDIRTLHVFVSWVEEATAKSSQALVLPSFLVLLYAVSRLPIWDGWHLHSIVMTVLLAPLAAMLIAAVLVRREAHQLRAVILDGLATQRLLLMEPPSSNDSRTKAPDHKQMSDYIKEVVSALQSMSRGAFCDIWHDPILGSALLFITTALTGPGRDAFGFLAKLAGIGL
jgi:hypothetical protein